MNYRDKKFASKKELFDFLRGNKHDLIEFKKATIKHTDPFGVSCIPSKVSDQASKLITNTENDTDNTIKRTIVGNTYYVMDSHDDVHIKGCFTNSIVARGAKRIAHLHDHIYKLEAKVGKFDDVYEHEIAWRDLGVDRNGNTWALLGDSEIKRILNENIFLQYKDGDIDQHSVGMWYVKMELALDDPDDGDHYKTWQTYIDLLLNKQDAIKQGYFWVIKEAKLIEISAVIAASNPITPTLPAEDKEFKAEASPENPEIKTDPSADSQTRKTSNFYHLIHN